jgi:hypothetical protein
MTSTSRLKNIDWHKFGAKTIINGFGGYGLYISYGHLVTMFETLQAPADQARFASAFIDGFMLLGRIMQSTRFCDRTNRIGHRLVVAGASASLIGNVAAGILARSLGAVIIGVPVVGGYLICEAAAGVIRSRVAVAKAQAAAEAARKRSEAAQRAVATKKANAAVAQATAPATKPVPKVTKPRARKPNQPAPGRRHPGTTDRRAGLPGPLLPAGRCPHDGRGDCLNLRRPASTLIHLRRVALVATAVDARPARRSPLPR